MVLDSMHTEVHSYPLNSLVTCYHIWSEMDRKWLFSSKGLHVLCLLLCQQDVNVNSLKYIFIPLEFFDDKLLHKVSYILDLVYQFCNRQSPVFLCWKTTWIRLSPLLLLIPLTAPAVSPFVIPLNGKIV